MQSICSRENGGRRLLKHFVSCLCPRINIEPIHCCTEGEGNWGRGGKERVREVE